jgi:hypothetical protein
MKNKKQIKKKEENQSDDLSEKLLIDEEGRPQPYHKANDIKKANQGGNQADSPGQKSGESDH